MQIRLASCSTKAQTFQNMLFMNPRDMVELQVTKSDLVVLNDQLVHRVSPDEEMKMGHMGSTKLMWAALNIVQDAAEGSYVTVHKWGDNEFDVDPPIQNVNIILDTFARAPVEVNTEDMVAYLLRSFGGEILCPNQRFVFHRVMEPNKVWFSIRVANVQVRKDGATETSGMRGLRSVKYGRLTEDSYIQIAPAKNRFLKLASAGGRQINLRMDWNAESMGVGGLDEQFTTIFRRAFASRLYPKEIVAQLGIKHVKGMLLFGPPGTGKTLIARCIGKMLTEQEPKIVNGPEILSKFVGQAEENIRNLFEDARLDEQENGEDADLHIIIFDEIDAICKQRGSVQSGTGVHDTVVNQLLSMIDGVKALNNVLVIGMTNRKDLLDQAMLRPGRLEVHVEIGLPDEQGREQIFRIHTRALRESGHWDEKVSIPELATKTKNYSGAEIEGVVRSAVSYAFNELLDQDQIRQLDKRAFQNVKVTPEIFDLALSEVQPEFGAQDDDLRLRYSSGIYKYSPEVKEICDTAENIARRLRASPAINRYSLLLRGVLGTGKTALACYLAQLCDFPLVRVISPESFVGWSEAAVCQNIAKVFDDAYKSPASIIIMDDFERLINYIDSEVGPRFSNLILQALLTCLRRQPEMIERKIFMIVTSTADPIRMLKIENFFDFIRDMPVVSSPDQFRNLLEEAGLFANCGNDVERIVESFSGSCGVKDVITVLELAQDEDGNITWESFRESWLSKFRGMGDDSKFLMF